MTRYSAALAAMLLAATAAAAADWSAPFDGKTLNGWKAEGNAAWTVEKRELVGRQGPGGAAGDLYSVAQWKNFELEAEWTMRFPGNSGIWFRVNGPQTGYQADFLDQSSHPGVLSGSLYCMGKAFIAENRDASTVKREGWNRIRIRASGDEFTIVQNGKEVVRVRDTAFPGAGSIGIQVHAGKQFDGMEVRIRNLRVRSLD